MKRLIIFISSCIICLYGCNNPEPVIENSLLLHGEEGRLWFLHHTEGENPLYLWFDQYGNFQTLELGIANEPVLFIPEENLPLSTECNSNILVYLNGLPYRMQTSDDVWVGVDEITGASFQLLERQFTPNEENFEWHQVWHAHYNPATEEVYWFLSRTFMPVENKGLNGRWDNLSDSTILLNGQPFRIFERKLQFENEYVHDWGRSDRELILLNSETKDSIRLLDACFPPYLNGYWKQDRNRYTYYEKWRKKWNKNIKSSVLLKGQNCKLYHCIEPGVLYWNGPFVYFDDKGLYTSFFFTNDINFTNTIADDLDWETWWYQKGNTIFEGRNRNAIFDILDVSASGDTIRLWDIEKGQEILFVDTKLPPPRKK